MEIVSEGSLESISRPSSTVSEKGRRSSKKVPNAQRLQPSSSLEILPPEEISGIPSELFSALEKDVEVEEFDGEEIKSDSSYDSEYSTDEEIGECYDDTEDNQIIAFEKNEETPDSSRTGNTSQQEDLWSALTDAEDVDPQIRAGMEKIKKLDKILAEKIKKEKEVKTQRHQMEKMWKEQLQQMVKTQVDGSHGNQNLVGATLLALELGNEEVLGSSRHDLVTPVFATQPLGTEESHPADQSSSASGSTTRGSSRSSTRNDSTKKDKNSGKKRRDQRRNSSQKDDGTTEKKTHKTKDKHKDSRADFIQRNKKLAADASNIIPMTDEEKKRLDELLSSDFNEMMENPYDDANLRLTCDVGYRPDEESARALAEIDEKLKALVPPTELEMLSSRALTDTPLTQRSEAPSNSSSQGTSRHVLENLDDVDIGEKVLREGKEARDLNQRISDIEIELKKLKEISEDQTENIISRALLDKLLGESSRTTSQSTTVAESVISSLTTPRHLAIEHGDQTPSEERPSEATPSTPGTISALSDVTLTSSHVDSPRTLTSSYSLGT